MGRTKRIRKKKSFESKQQSNKCSDLEFIEAIKKLYVWLGELGWKNETCLSHRYFPNTGRGLYSKKNIEPENLLIRIPFDALITLYSIENDESFRKFFAPSIHLFENNKLTFQSLLSVFILFHNHLKNSYYQPYIKTIPKTFTNPIFCIKTELMHLPEDILEIVVKQNQALKCDYNALNEAFKKRICNCCNENYFPNIISFDLFKWAYFAVNSRCVYIDPDVIKSLVEQSMFIKILKDNVKLALVPFLDLINHSDKAHTDAKFSCSKNNLKEIFKSEKKKIFYELYTKITYKRYNQIFINYGHHTNKKLLIEYGFFLKENFYEYFEFNILDIEKLIHSNSSLALKFKNVNRNKFKFIKDHNLHEQMFINLHDGFSHNLQITLYLIFKCETYFPNVLNQIAFGSIDNLENLINCECKLLIEYKIEEYKEFIKGLENLNELTESGCIVLNYMYECIFYLERCLNKFF